MTWPRPRAIRSRLVPTLLDRLLEVEPRLRRRRRRAGIALLVATMIGTVAWADAYLWPGISLAFGYAVPITLGAYVFGVRRGVELSGVCVVLRGVCAGRAYGPWWLYAGGALMLAEYLALAVGGGLLGRAARRLARQARVLQRLSEATQTLTTALESEAVWREGIEAAVHLTGANGGCVATAREADWQATDVFVHGQWLADPIVWWPHRNAPWGAETPTSTTGGTVPDETSPLRRWGAEVQLAVPLTGPEPGQRHALVVFRAEPRRFERPTAEVLQLLALQMKAALQAAALYHAATEAAADKGRLLAHLAHELAVPLHVVVGSIDMLATHVDAAGRSGLQRLRRQERLLLEMTHNLLEYARLDVGQRPDRWARVDVPALFREVQDLAEPLIGDKDVHLEVRVGVGAESVESDRDRLRRIVANLAINAVKYTPAGSVELRAERDNGAIRIAVRDTGPGIAPSERQRVFEPFYRSGTAPVGSGVGLGLALAQELAHLLGTEIVLDSREGEGTTFSLLLPPATAGGR